MLFSLHLNGQQEGVYSLEVIPDRETDLLDEYPLLKDSLTHENILIVLDSMIQYFRRSAYLEASLDSSRIEGQQFLAFVHFGPAYKWAHIKNGNIEKAYFEGTGYRLDDFNEQLFDFKALKKLQDALLDNAEKSGFPFASTYLDSVQISDGEIFASLMMEKNNPITFGTLTNEGNLKITDAYLRNYLGIKSGELYNKEKVLGLKDKLNDLAFVSIEKDPSVIFKGEEADVNLFLAKKNASRFDFLFGLLPTENGMDENRYRFTITFDADLYNQLGFGERVYMKFQNLRPQTQELVLGINYPYLLDLPFGLDATFNLYKRDTSFLNIEYNFGVQYLLEGGNFVKAFVSNESTNLISVNSSSIINQRALPNTLDVSTSNIGLEYVLRKLDYRFNPRKGLDLRLTGTAGLRKIKENNDIIALVDPNDETFSFASLYDSISTRNFQSRIDTDVSYYLPIGKRSTLKLQNRTGMLLTENAVYDNELFRIGGSRILRGFDDESIFANFYTINTLEYRLLIARNSFLSAFGDYAIIRNKNNVDLPKDSALGFGAGLTFDTQVGVFNISYAVGKTTVLPFDLRTAKIHLGYISLF